MAASKLLDAAAAYVILLSFAAEDRKSYWSGCIQAAKWLCQQIFSILALVTFLLTTPFKKCFKIVFFFALASRSGFGAAVSDAVARNSIVVLQLSLCRSHWNGCVKVAWCRGCIRNTLVFCS